jgi:hypothetical protein
MRARRRIFLQNHRWQRCHFDFDRNDSAVITKSYSCGGERVKGAPTGKNMLQCSVRSAATKASPTHGWTGTGDQKM